MGRPGNVVQNIPGIPGEKVLIAAIVQQAVSDLDAPNPEVRRRAVAFLQNRPAVYALTDLINVEQGVVDRYLTRLFAERQWQREQKG
jgi:hypothetical protein